MRALTIGTFNSRGLARPDLWPDLLADLPGPVDVLAVQEATHAEVGGYSAVFDAERILTGALTERFGADVGWMRGMHTAALDGGPMGQLVFLRYPRVRVGAHWRSDCRDAARDKPGVLDVCVPGSIPIRVRGVHLPYWSGDARLDCARQWTRFAADPAILLGDWNSMHPSDPNEPPWDRLPRHKRHHKAIFDGERWVADRRALTELVRAGFVSAAAVRGDWTATVNPGVDEGAEAAIDQILVSPALAEAIAPESYRVHVGRSAELASDHRMVSVTLDLDRTGAGT